MQGLHLEKFIAMSNELMVKQLINKSKEVKFALLSSAEINNMYKDIDNALSLLWSLDKQHYLSAERYADMSNRESILDHFLGIDCILSDNRNRQLIGIDWTCKPGMSLIDKIEKHRQLLPCHNLVFLKKVAVVYVHNADLIEVSKNASLVYKIFKQVIEKVNHSSFQGGLTIDIKNLIK